MLFWGGFLDVQKKNTPPWNELVRQKHTNATRSTQGRRSRQRKGIFHPWNSYWWRNMKKPSSECIVKVTRKPYGTALWAFHYKKGIALLSPCVWLWDWRALGKEGTTLVNGTRCWIPKLSQDVLRPDSLLSCLDANKSELINCISRYSRYRSCNSLYRFQWFGATFKTKERWHEEFLINPFAGFSSAKSK